MTSSRFAHVSTFFLTSSLMNSTSPISAVDAASGAMRARSRRGVTFPSPSCAFFAALALRRVIGGEEVPLIALTQLILPVFS